MSTRLYNHKLTPHSHDELLCCGHGTTKNNLKFNKEKKTK